QDDDIHRWQPQVVGDADVALLGLLQLPFKAPRRVEQADLVAGLDPQLLGQWCSRVPSHDFGIMQPPRKRSNRKAKSSHNYTESLHLEHFATAGVFGGLDDQTRPRFGSFRGLVKNRATTPALTLTFGFPPGWEGPVGGSLRARSLRPLEAP